MSSGQHLEAPAVVAPLGWRPVDPLRIEGGRGSFVSGDPLGGRLRVAYFADDRGRLVGRAWFGAGALGPPGHAHGGSMAAVLDEAMGAAAWMAGHRVVAVRLTSNFQRMLPLGTDAFFEAWVERTEGRRVFTRGRLTDELGNPFAEGEAIFLELDSRRFEALLAQRSSP